MFTQTVRHRDFFLPPDTGKPGPADDAEHAEPPTTREAWTSLVLLAVALVAVVGLAKVESHPLENAVDDAGLPHAFVGVVIATLVLLPEGIAAVRAAARDRAQVSLNLAYGSAIASIGLTVPVIAVAKIWLDGPLTLGLESTQLVLLFLSALVGVLTVVPGRSKPLQGALHLVLLATFIVVSDPSPDAQSLGPVVRLGQLVERRPRLGETRLGVRDHLLEALGPEPVVTPSTASAITGSRSEECSGWSGRVAGASIESELLMANIQTQPAALAGDLSALDVGELLADLAVAEPEYVGTAHVPRPVVAGPVEAPRSTPRSPQTNDSSSVNAAPGVLPNTSSQTARTASAPSWRSPSGAGPVASKTQSSVISDMIESMSPLPNAAENLASPACTGPTPSRARTPPAGRLRPRRARPRAARSPRPRGRSLHARRTTRPPR